MLNNNSDAVSRLLVAAFDKGLDIETGLMFLLSDENGSPIAEAEHLLQVWKGVNLLLDTRKLDFKTATMLMTCEKSLAELLIITSREKHDLILDEKRRSNRPDARAFVESYLLVGQDGMELYIRTKMMLEEMKNEQSINPTLKANIFFVERIQKLEDVLNSYEVSLRSGITTDSTLRKPRSSIWRRLFERQ